MKDIQFTKQGKTYVAEFEVNADFNLHIEKSQSGYLYMRQRSTSGKWDSVRNFQVADNDYIVDYDFTALVYPKQIRLVSEYAPTMCVLTSDGDVIEIKSQSKEVEITQNGEMSVTPDDGFAYLSSVNVKTNVPQQGGEESGGGEDSFYWKIEPNLPKEDIKGMFGIFARLLSVVKIEYVGGIFDTTFSFLSKDGNNGKSVYVRTIKSSNFIMLEEDTDGYMGFPYSVTSFDELLVMLQIPKEDAVAIGIVEITKEEFYNLES